MIARILTALAAFILLSAAAAPEDPFAAFGARPAVEDISLSPNGTKIAFIAPGPAQSTILYVSDVAAGSSPQRTLVADGKPERLSGCFWVSEERLVCRVYMVMENGAEVSAATRYVAVNAGGGNLRLVTRPTRSYDSYVSHYGGAIIDALPGEDGAILMGQVFVPEERQATRMNDSREGFGVERVDTKDGSTRIVEQPKKDAVEFISDGMGVVRIMGSRGASDATGYARNVMNYYYRTKGSRDWRSLGEYNLATGEGFNPYVVDPTLDVAYGFKRENGRLGLYSVALDGSKRETLVYGHPQVDVDGLIRIGRRQRVVGASYATEKRQAAYFDPELTALGRSLSKALPGLPLIQFIDSSMDETKLLIMAGSDVDPGRYYIYDKTAKSLNEIMLSRPDLEGVALAQVKPVTYKAADGTDVPAYLTLPPGSDGKNLPALVMPHGGPSARDEWGFDWLAQFFALRGYAVLQPNYRGSSGYGDAWFQQNGFQSWRTAMGDVNDAGRWLVSQGIADPGKLGIFGWSYGGYAALQSNVLDPALFKAAVAIAPVTDLAQLKQLSQRWSDYRLTEAMIGSGPHVQEGSPAQNASRIRAPVLIFHGERDLNVPIEQARLMADRLKDAGKKAELVVYPNIDHFLTDAEVRTDMLRRSDAFLRASMGIK